MRKTWTALASGIMALIACDATAEGRRAVVFDIDGTLTPNVYSVSIARQGAATAVNIYDDAGVEIIYLTARIPMFQSGVQSWLAENGFPSGRLYLTETEADRDDHGAFKARILNAYRADGWMILAAFGDSSSDFAAYASAGIPQERVFALKRIGAWDCKQGVWQGCFRDWADLMPAITMGLSGIDTGLPVEK